MRRRCYYKDCDSNSDNVQHKNITLFKFPKDADRREEWFENAQVLPRYRKLPTFDYYICSNHFDQKYISINNRRRNLVGRARPIPYYETCETDNMGLFTDEQDDLRDLGGDDNAEHNLDEYDVGSTTLDIDMEQSTKTPDSRKSSLSLEVEEIQQKINVEEHAESSNELKRKMATYSTSSCSKGDTKIIKLQKLRSRTPSNTAISSTNALIINKIQYQKEQNLRISKPDAQIEDDQIAFQFLKEPAECVEQISTDDAGVIDEDSLLPTSNVSTFIFKNEEYLQMPKSAYIQEKIEMMRKLRKYERIIETIKFQINQID